MPDSERGAASHPNALSDDPRIADAQHRAYRHALNAPTLTEPEEWWTGDDGPLKLWWAMRDAGVPERYRDSEWEQVREDSIRQWTRPIQDGEYAGECLILSGPVGTGKSSASALIVQEAVKRRMSARYVYVPDLIERMQHGSNRWEATSAQMHVGLLVWDDLGVGGLADWQVGWLDRIVERRYQRGLGMVVTTNLTPRTLQHTDELRRMVDRWRENGTLVVIGGESKRKET